jgi:hypothetical protein
MSLKKGWAEVEEHQRDALLRLYERDDYTASDVAEYALNQFGIKIKPATLSRRLREWRELRELDEAPELNGVKMKGDANRIEVWSSSSRIRTLEDLLEAAELDLEDWEVVSHEINSYESFRKHQDKDLDYSGGKIEKGHIKDKGGVVIVPLFQVKAKLIRKEPVKVRPVIEPISFAKINLPKPPKRKSSGIKRYALLFDPQFGFRREDIFSQKLVPFHSRPALDVALQIVEDTAVDGIVLGGDVLDLADVSDKFVREVEFVHLLQPTLLETGWWMAQLRMAAPEAEMVYLEGNHERRVPLSILNNMRSMWKLKPIKYTQATSKIQVESDPLLSVPGMLQLDQLGISYIGGYPDGEYWLNKYLKVIHGDIARSQHQSTVRAKLKNVWESVIMGHIHRFETASKTVFEQQEIRTVTVNSIGCLCRIDGTVPGYSEKAQWQQGMAVVEVDTDGHLFSIDPIYIDRGSALYNGQVYTARERTDQLNDEVEWEGAF